VVDLQKGIAHLVNAGMAEENAIGAYGFSGSGFSQVLLTMDDPRIAALADIESALYGEGIWKIFSSSDYYDVSKLRVPFLHIYGKYLGMRDVSFDEFYRAKYSHRYHLLLNQPGLHHWDVATEGRASAMVLHNRGQLERGVKASFELANIYLLNFFNAVLKKDKTSQKTLDTKTMITGYHDTLWTIQQYPALKPPPDKLQFEELIKRKGIDEAIELARDFHKVDSTADFVSENGLNHLAQILQQKNNLKDGIRLMHLATEFYPDKAWLWLNLGVMQETIGDINGAIQSCEKVMELLKDMEIKGLSFNERIKKSAMDALKRLKKT
jgi:tetratricopeptide (TPR) repeat protein